MTACSRLALVASVSVIAACGYRELPPPAAPTPIVPDVPELPATPPADGTGRLLIDSDGEPAKVARVTERIEPPAGVPVVVAKGASTPYGVKSELLCMTPCAADLRTGATTLVFTSLRDPARKSTVDVAVPRGTTVVRHRIGTETPWAPGYFGGALFTLLGGGLTLMGGVALGVGLTASPTVDREGRTHDPKEIAVAGAVIGTVGLAALIGGIALMTSNRPVKQEGATTTFRATR